MPGVNSVLQPFWADIQAASKSILYISFYLGNILKELDVRDKY